MTARKTILFLFASAAMALAQTHWVGTWGTSPAPQLASAAQMYSSKLFFENQTLREIVHTSIGGGSVRVHLSNAYGNQMVEVGAVHIAVRAKNAGIAPGSDRVLTFGGRRTVALSTNAPALSDPVKLDVPAGGDLAISIYLPKAAEGAGIHYSAQQTSYIGKGDQTAAASIANPEMMTSWVFLTGVDVLAPESASAVVAFGDSITDGARSTVDANHRWPDFLAERLRERGGREVGVLNAGIGGNRVLRDPAENIRFGMNALARFDRDVLSQPGVRYVIVLEGINDLGHPGVVGPHCGTADRGRPDRGPGPDDRARTRAGLEDIRRDAHAICGNRVLGLLHAGKRRDPQEGQQLDSYVEGVRRRDRLRQGGARSEPSGRDSAGL